MLNIVGRACVIVGGGQVAARKVTGLLEAGAQVTVIAPEVSAPVENLEGEGRITIRLAAYKPGMLADFRPLLVFAATDDPVVNMQVAEESRSLGAFVDVVDSPDASDFSGMAVFRRGPVAVAVSTGGASPALAVHLKQRLEDTIGDEYSVLARWLAELRPQVRQAVAAQADRQKLWQAILESRILDELRQGNETAARRLLDELVAAMGSDRK